jgi:ribosomal protein S18 acetylase RimI-like enzyme
LPRSSANLTPGIPRLTPPLTIRPATAADLDAIAAVGVDADTRFLAAGYPAFADGAAIPADVAERAIVEARLWVAERAGALLGWSYQGRIDGELCLGQISVAVSAGRQGVGTALLTALIDRARSAGEPSVVLNTQADVPFNAPWYQHHGFEVVPEAAWSDGLRRVTAAQEAGGMDWTHRVHLRLRLTPPG